ncbi:MAG: hypothetical protein ACREJ6_05330 [Candidatus Methylomirabilis sp.]
MNCPTAAVSRRSSHLSRIERDGRGPRRALQLFLGVRGARFLGLHWGTFDMADEPSEEPPQRLEGEARRLGLGPEQVWVLKPGEARRW